MAGWDKTLTHVDWLMSMRDGYGERTQRLRARQLKEEMGEMRDKPVITEYARGLERGGVPVEVRLSKVKKQRPQQEEEKFSFSPKINEASKGKTAKYNNAEWQAQARRRVEELKKARDEQEKTHLPSPRVAGREKICGMEHYDYLLMANKEKEQLMYGKYEEAHCDAREGLQAKPEISQYAKNYKPTEEDVVQRLYTTDASPLSVSTMTRNEASSSPVRGGSSDVFGRLTQPDGGRKASSTAENVKEIKRRASMSHVSKASEMILSSMDPSRDRTMRLSHQNPHHPKNDEKPPRSGYYLQQKKMSQKDLDGMWRRWDNAEKKRAVDNEKVKVRVEEEEAKECCFDPRIAPALLRSRSLPYSRSSSGGSYVDVVEKATTWVARKEHRLAKLKEASEREELEFCTFQPYVNEEVPLAEVDVNRLKGYGEYVTRMKKARSMKQEKTRLIEETFKSGDRWSGRSTTPRAPSLGVSCNTTVASLSPPVQVPTRRKHNPPPTTEETHTQAMQAYYASPEYREWYDQYCAYHEYYSSQSRSGSGGHSGYSYYGHDQPMPQSASSGGTSSGSEVDPPPEYASSEGSEGRFYN